MKRLLQTTGLIFVMLLLANVGMAQTFSPANGATGVSTSPTLTITFDGPVTLGVFQFIYLKKEGGTQVKEFLTGVNGAYKDPCLVVSGNILTIDLSQANLEGNTSYYVTAEANVIFVGGNSWDGLKESENSSIWSFTTGETPVDPETPTINTVKPSPGASGISINTSFTVDFDSESDIQLGSSASFKIKRKDDNVLKLIFLNGMEEISVSGNQLNIDATNFNLDYNTTYYVEIDPGFIENYSGLSGSNYWTFTTETAPPKWAENYPTITQSSSDFTFTGKADLTGNYYFVVTGSLTPPNKEQIKAGENRSGGKALESFNEAMIGNDEFTKTMDYGTNFPAGSYFLHTLVASDDGKNGEVKTLLIDRTPPSINNASYPINNFELFPVADSILIIFSEKVFNYNGGVTELTSASFTLKNGEEIVPFVFSVSSDGTEVTLTPQEPLSGNTKYEVEIAPLSDDYYNVMSSSVTRTFYTDQLNVWNGESSSLWLNPENWEEAYVPGKSVLIQSGAAHYPTINSDITVNNFTIEAGGVVTQTGGVITVLGDFDLLSSEATNASYLPKGGELDVQGETRVHQHIVPGKGLIDYLMGPPTDGTNYANFGTPYLIKYYENPTDSWVSIGTTNMLLGVGYAVYSLNDLIFRGNINRTAIEVPLKRTTGKGYGWNLLGNPYTATLNWGTLGVDTARVENSYWVWNTENRVYRAFNQEAGIGLGLEGEIPSNHGFLVKLKIGQTSGVFNFSTNALIANTKNYLKSVSKTKPPHMKVSAGNAEFTDQLAVAFVPDASSGVDKYDTEKFFGSGNPFQIFTVEGATKLSINSLPDVGEETTINLGYQSSKAGSYTIRLKEDNLEHSEVILTDTKEGVSVDLLYEGSYTFNVNKKETNNTRFTLTFPANIPTSVAKDVPTDNMNIYLKEGDVIVDVRGEAESLTYEMVGVTGNIVGRGNLHSGVNNLGKFPPALFIINTRNGEGTIVSKKLLVTH